MVNNILLTTQTDPAWPETVAIMWGSVNEIFPPTAEILDLDSSFLIGVVAENNTWAYRQSIAGRWLLANLLAAESQGCVQGLAFDAYRKPRLSAGGLEFNVSHDGDVVALAHHRQCSVGLDVLAWATDMDDGVIAVMASASEWVALQRLSMGERRAASVTLWTAKEAVMKALGFGMHREPAEIEIGVLSAGQQQVRVCFEGTTLALSVNVDWPCQTHCLSCAVVLYHDR